MKKSLYAILALALMLIVSPVSAEEIYYTNSNGVSLTEEEYDFMDYFFFEGSQDLMTADDYERFVESNIMNGEIDKVIYREPLQATTRGTLFGDSNRQISISKSCESNCLISVAFQWFNSPTIRSYDVMGAYMSDTTLANAPSTSLSYSGGSSSITNIKKQSNAFGVSIDLPDSGSNIKVSQIFRVNTGGHVYATYQHAKSNTTLATSKNYTFGHAGYGRVFIFSGTAANVYDDMNGVDIAV